MTAPVIARRRSARGLADPGLLRAQMIEAHADYLRAQTLADDAAKARARAGHIARQNGWTWEKIGECHGPIAPNTAQELVGRYRKSLRKRTKETRRWDPVRSSESA